jgi:predicted SnoaL-like aldol condensation-catalyzing enzyme
MKKKLFVISTAVLCFLISCNNEKTETKESSAAQKNLDATHVVMKAFETGDISMIDSVISSDFVDHTDMGDKNRDSLKAMITTMHSKMPDMKFEPIKELADDDYAMSWSRYTGTSDGSMGIPKGPMKMTAIDVVKFKDGKATEHWEFRDMQEMMKMMGSQPGMQNMMMDHKMDTTKKM